MLARLIVPGLSAMASVAVAEPASEILDDLYGHLCSGKGVATETAEIVPIPDLTGDGLAELLVDAIALKCRQFDTDLFATSLIWTGTDGGEILVLDGDDRTLERVLLQIPAMKVTFPESDPTSPEPFTMVIDRHTVLCGSAALDRCAVIVGWDSDIGGFMCSMPIAGSDEEADALMIECR